MSQKRRIDRGFVSAGESRHSPAAQDRVAGGPTAEAGTPWLSRLARRALGAMVACTAASCIPTAGDSVVGPPPPNDLKVVAEVDAANVFTGSAVELSATVSGGTPPYIFRWDQNGGTTDVTLSTPQNDRTRTGELRQPGRYVFRVTVIDSAGLHDVDYLPVIVLDPFEVDVPPLAVGGQDVELLVDTGLDVPEGTTFLWELIGPGILDDPAAKDATFTATGSGTIDLSLTVEIPSASRPLSITRTFEIAAIPNLRPRVLVDTTLGDFTIELDAGRAPAHVGNFLLYVDDGFYDGVLIHRVVCDPDPEADGCLPFVIQGGGHRREGGELVDVEAARPPVESEADNGLTNGELYTVSLALLGGNQNSGTTQFFINLDGNEFLDDQGFTVFGKVVGGREVVDMIVRVDTIDSPLLPGEQSLPEVDIVIERISRLAN